MQEQRPGHTIQYQSSWSGFVASYGFCRRRHWHPTPVLLPGKSHGWRSLVGCSPWGRDESDMTERLHFHFSLLCIGEGNGNPLQCSCLENSSDGVAQSRTRLKWLSSSSSSTVSAVVLPKVCGLAAHRSKANKQARLVERKVCFISDAGNWRGGQTYVQRLILPTAIRRQ